MLLHGADAASYDDAHAVRIFFGKIQFRMKERLSCGSYSILRKQFHALGGFKIHVISRIETQDFSGQFYRRIGHIDLRDRTDPVSTFFQSLPECIHIISQRSNGAHAGDHDSSCFHFDPSSKRIFRGKPHIGFRLPSLRIFSGKRNWQIRPSIRN